MYLGPHVSNGTRKPIQRQGRGPHCLAVLPEQKTLKQVIGGQNNILGCAGKQILR